MAFPVKIAGLGAALPERRVFNDELESRMRLTPGWIERATGIIERRFASTETTLSLAVAASREAIRAAGLNPTDLDLVVGASTGPHQAIPCTGVLVQRELGLADGRCFGFDVNATCLSFLAGLQAVGPMLAAGMCQHALVFSSEVANHMRNFDEPESAVLLGDGAAAAVLIRTPPNEASTLHGSHFETHASGADLTVCLGGGTFHHPNDPATTQAMNQFHMEGRAVFKMARRALGPFFQTFFNRVHWTVEMVDHVIPHQASGPGLELLERSCGFRMNQVVRNITNRGNCVAASIPLAFSEAVTEGRIQRGDRVVLAGTGAGLSIGAIAVTF